VIEAFGEMWAGMETRLAEKESSRQVRFKLST
jgi:hypothetical protein